MAHATLDHKQRTAVRYVVRADTPHGRLYASHEPYGTTPEFKQARVFEHAIRAEVAARLWSTLSALHSDSPVDFAVHRVSVSELDE